MGVWGGGGGGGHSQLAEFLAGLPGVRSDPADGVVLEVEVLQRHEAVEPALTDLRQVVVVQLPAVNTNSNAFTTFLSHLDDIRTISNITVKYCNKDNDLWHKSSYFSSQKICFVVRVKHE